MVLITPIEILYFMILTLVIGYIFSDKFSIRPKTVYDMIHPRRFNKENLIFASLVTAPAVILHELGHKFTAMAFGYTAQFFIWPLGLVIAVVLKIINSPLILIAPGYVGIPPVADPLQYRLIAAAGPLVNLLLLGISLLILKYHKKLKKKQTIFLALTKQINLILFVFNVLPIPPLDGSKIFLPLS